MTKAKDTDRENLQRVKEKSDDDFEKNITYISAGALGLSMTFIEKIVNLPKAIHFWILITAWGLLTLTLLANLLSHYLSSYYHEKTTDEFDDENPDILQNIDKRNKRLRQINVGTVISLILGIIFLIIFSSINLYQMSDKNQKSKTTTESKIQESPNYEKLGRTITKPSSASSSTKPATSDDSQQSSNNKK
jgi:ABC-type transport system involved in multi-copper enzyme maturation permease subunit